MGKKFIFFLIIGALIYTLCTPYIFKAYIKEADKGDFVPFGSPFPFIEQMVEQPLEKEKTPHAITFMSYGANFPHFQIGTWILSFIVNFIVLLAIAYLVGKFFSFNRKS